MQKYINAKVLINGTLQKVDFAIDNKGKIILNNLDRFTFDETIDLVDKVVSPGFIDIHVHTRVPGFEYKEDIQSVTKAALAGGFTTIVAMANVDPSPWNVENLKDIQAQANNSSINIIQAAKVTNDNKVNDIEQLSKHTNIFSDDGEPISNPDILIEALNKIKETNSVILLHEDDNSKIGYAYRSKFTRKHNIPSVKASYEWKIVKRDIEINKNIGAKMHIQHPSSRKTVSLLKKAIKNNINVTAEITPHHLFFNSSDITSDNANFKMNPPIGSKRDQKALVNAFKKNIINIIATDHAPHSLEEKNKGFKDSMFGIIGLQTAFAAFNTYLGPEYLEQILRALTINPAKLIGIENDIIEGQKANIVIIDPNKEFVFKEEDILSKSKNSPFINMKLKGSIEKFILK